MPKINQTIVIEPGGARRLMVKGKGKLRVEDVMGTKYVPGDIYRGGGWEPIRKMVPLDGPYIGTKRVPRANAKKHPVTGQPQTSYVLVKHPRREYNDNDHAVPPSDVEFYWQRGQLKNGRFYPDKEEVSPPDPQPAQPTP